MQLFSLFVFCQNKSENNAHIKFEKEKKRFFVYKIKVFQILKKKIFPKGLTHAFGQKMQFFSLFLFGQKKTRNKVK